MIVVCDGISAGEVGPVRNGVANHALIDAVLIPLCPNSKFQNEHSTATKKKGSNTRGRDAKKQKPPTSNLKPTPKRVARITRRCCSTQYFALAW